ncbi:MAG: hypothetical protein WBP86_00385, partial [Thiobacillaceae bacterium]
MVGLFDPGPHGTTLSPQRVAGIAKKCWLRASLAKIVVSEVTFDNRRISHGGCYQKNACNEGWNNSGGSLAISRP